MEAESKALARRAVVAWSKCGLDWMPGMACRNSDGFGFIVLNVDTKGRLLLWNPPWSSETRLLPSGSVLPDMEAHATLGCIEHGMLPAAWGDGCYVDRIDDALIVRKRAAKGPPKVMFESQSRTLQERLIAALEAAHSR